MGSSSEGNSFSTAVFIFMVFIPPVFYNKLSFKSDSPDDCRGFVSRGHTLHSCVGVVCLSHAESGHKSIRKPAVGVKNGNAPFLIYSVLACSVPDGKICV